MAGKKPNKRNVVRNASSRPTKFYYVLGAIAVVGASILGWTLLRKPAAPVGTDIAPSPIAAAGTSRGYTMGKADAPVEIIEYGDFECPGCGYFAIVTEPDVRKRLVETGLAKFTFMDFPLNIHKNTVPAHNAAACADDQGKFWEMHDLLFAKQDQWNTQATDKPKPFFEKYAVDLGLNKDVWLDCYNSRKHEARIMGNFAAGERRQVNTTPSFVIGSKLYVGALGYDALKAIVDSATRK